MHIGKKILSYGLGSVAGFLAENLLTLFWKKGLHRELPQQGVANSGKIGVQLFIFTAVSAAVSAGIRLLLEEKGRKALPWL